jgi:hypothetical protein
MPRFFFDVKDGHRLIDPAGLDCRDAEQAMAQAGVIADQIAADAPASSGRHVSVLDDERREVGSVTINAHSKEKHHGGEQANRGQRPQGGSQETFSGQNETGRGERLDEAE